MSLEERSLFRPLGWLASILGLSSVYWVRTNEGMGPPPPQAGPIELHWVLRSYPSHNNYLALDVFNF